MTLSRHATTARSRWNETWALALAFGLASIPWTYAFTVGDLPLWPSFIASASFFAAGGGVAGLKRGYASNLAGIGYAAATIGLTDAYLGGSVVALSVIVGAFMFIASLHAFVPLLSFTPGAFFGFATMFGVDATGATIVVAGLPGAVAAAVVAMLIGASIGLGAEWTSERLS